MEQEKKYSVYVDSVEVNDCLLTEDEARNLADEYIEDGYDNVEIIKL